MSEKTKTAWRRWWLLPVIIIPAISIFWRAAIPSKTSDTWQTAVVSRGSIENAVTAVGTVQPRAYVDVGVQVSGQLRNLRVKPGDTVQQGMLLAEIDPAIFAARVLEAEANLENLKAQLRIREQQALFAAQQNSRTAGLLKEDAVAAKEMESADSALKVARAEIDVVRSQIRQAEAALQTAQTNLRYTKIIAPISGTVVSITAREGQTLNANQQAPVILRIADLSTMTVWAQVSEADVARLTPGGEVYFTVLGSPDKRWSGTLGQILPTPEIINNVTLYNALFNVSNSGGALKVQMTAQVFFILEKAQDVLVVPLSAIQAVDKTQKGGGAGKNGKGKASKADGKNDGNGTQQTKKGKKHSVRVLKEDGSIEERPVTTGIVTQVSAEIRSGLDEGETVITGMAQTKKTGNGQGGKKGGKL